jgi:hypothetical protein
MRQRLTGALLVAAAVVLLPVACSSTASRSLLQIDVTGDQPFVMVALQITAGDTTVSFSVASFDANIPFSAGVYLPPGVLGPVHLTAVAEQAGCVIGRGSTDVPTIMPGATNGPVALRVSRIPCAPIADAGASDGPAADAAQGAGGAPGSGGQGSGGAAAGLGGAGGLDSDLVLYYPFDEASGSVAGDVSGFTGGPRDGDILVAGTGTFAFTTSAAVGSHALDLTGGSTSNGAYVQLPSVLPLAPDAMTIAVWVYVKTAVRFQKILSFGTSQMAYMSLTPNAVRPTNVMRTEFEITTVGDVTGAQIVGVDGDLPAGAWHHVAVVLPEGASYGASLYIDGALVSTTTLSLRPSALGDTPQNYLGRSAFTTTAYADMMLDDFRIYRRALSTDEVAAIMNVH